jgi:protein ImuA
MSQSDSSERVSFLRDRIARVEAGSGPAQGIARSCSRLSLGDTRLDSLLRGGLASGALHEIVAATPGDAAAASGFTLALAARFMAGNAKARKEIVWILENYAGSETGMPYGPGLALHGVDPARLLLVHTFHAQESLWAMEEALKSQAPAAVIGEIWTIEKAYDLVASRRLVLAAQKSGTPGLMLAAGMAGSAHRLSTGAETRFEIRSQPSFPIPSAGMRMPLPGKAAWSVRIVKARPMSSIRPDGFDFDRSQFWPVFWDHEKACFRDAISLPLAALPRHRPDPPVESEKRRQTR